MSVATPATVRRAQPADFGALAAVLARAFDDDPLTVWLYPSARTRQRHARRFFAVRLRQLRPQDEIYTTDDRAGAALWALPERWREDARQTLMLVPTLPGLLTRMPRAMRVMTRIEARHPARPHLYLSVLGTEPGRQRTGVGSALLGPVLERCDREGLPAYLESSRERNLAFYARHGFEVTERLELPSGAPPLWLMWRDPR